MEKTLATEQHRNLIQLLIKAREEAELTQEELANALGEYQSFVARLESGQRRLDVIEFIQITSVMNVDAGSILRKLSNANS